MIVSPAIIGTVRGNASLHIPEVQRTTANTRAKEGQRIRIVRSRTVARSNTEPSERIPIETVTQRAIDNTQPDSNVQGSIEHTLRKGRTIADLQTEIGINISVCPKRTVVSAVTCRIIAVEILAPECYGTLLLTDAGICSILRHVVLEVA